MAKEKEKLKFAFYWAASCGGCARRAFYLDNTRCAPKRYYARTDARGKTVPNPLTKSEVTNLGVAINT